MASSPSAVFLNFVSILHIPFIKPFAPLGRISPAQFGADLFLQADLRSAVQVYDKTDCAICQINYAATPIINCFGAKGKVSLRGGFPA